MSFWQKLKTINNWNAQMLFPDYKFNKIIFRVAILLLLAWLILAALSVPWSLKTQVHVSCPDDSHGFCENPFYKNNYVMMGLNPISECPDKTGALCEKEWLAPGESWGNVPNFFYDYKGLATAFFVVGAILLNHFLYNRGYFKSRMNEVEK